MNINSFQKEFLNLYKRNSKSPLFSFLDNLKDTKNISTTESQHIYLSNYIGGQIQLLTNIFKQTKNILGSDSFNFFCTQYIGENLDFESNRNFYGKGFSHFMENNTQLNNQIPFLKDLMTFEWLNHEINYLSDEFGDSFFLPTMKFLCTIHPIDEFYHGDFSNLEMREKIILIWRKKDQHFSKEFPSFYKESISYFLDDQFDISNFLQNFSKINQTDQDFLNFCLEHSLFIDGQNL